MRVAFFSEATPVDSLGVEYLAAVLVEHGIEVASYLDIRPFDRRADLLRSQGKIRTLLATQPAAYAERLLAWKPDVVAFSVVTDWYQAALAVAREVKRQAPDVVTVFGGPHVTAGPRTVLEERCIDFACVGEGELALLALVRAVERGEREPEIRGMYFRAGDELRGSGAGELVEDLDRLPFVDKEPAHQQWPITRHVYTVMSARGCYYRCTFCASPYTRQIYREGGDQFLRRRTVANLVDELEGAVKRHPYTRYVHFSDDTFVQKPAWMWEFARAYGERVGLPFWCQTIPNLTDPDLAQALAKAGWASVELGVQSADEAIRNQAMLRPETDADIARTVTMLRKHRVFVYTDHIVRAEVDDAPRLEAAVEFYNRIRPDWIHVYPYRDYPGIATTLTARRDGSLSDQEASRVDRGLGLESVPVGLPARSLGSDAFKRAEILIGLLIVLPLLPARMIGWALRNYRKACVLPLGLLELLPDVVFAFARAWRAVTPSGDFSAKINVAIAAFGPLVAFRHAWRRDWEKIATVRHVQSSGLPIEAAKPAAIARGDGAELSQPDQVDRLVGFHVDRGSREKPGTAAWRAR